MNGRRTRAATLLLAVLMAVALNSAWGKSETLPPAPDWHTADDCQWQWLNAGGIGLWAERCTLSTGDWAVLWRPETQAFELNHNGQWRGVVVQAFQVRGEHWQDDVGDALTAAGHLDDDSTCHFQPIALRPAVRTIAFYQLQPRDHSPEPPSSERDQVPDPQCGPYGASTHGVRYFVHDLRTPGHIVFIDEGQERPMFDPTSVRVRSHPEHPAMTAQRDPQLQAFWDALASHCGQAFEGVRVVARDDRPDLLEGNETLVVHFRQCNDDLLAAPFHIGPPDGDWDRSRTWRFTWTEDGQQLELRHDHRLADGSSDLDNTMYGGLSIGGDRSMQRFLYTERVADDGSALGWQIEIVPGERYTYGTFSGDQWTWRLDFDLSAPLAEPPPPPWGFNTPP